ncbi:hypothetical protein AJ79_04462 [Helicocarpus griseus UAMH5409]|uniref:Uncharacterized protein n=1 Tax=Helicocarpus griseus UAMH5409 TaxID=1447875 RepID=A0A2B7XU98_9EURO|nr:hypothetical protein AJ79_04462 [Helicocarpus griseus UAMH5409]
MYTITRDVRKDLASHNIHVTVEVIDVRGLSIRSFGILPSDLPTISAWNGHLQGTVIGYLDRINLEWTSLNVLHRGLGSTRDSCPRTLVICAKDAAEDRWWQEALPTLRNLCRPTLEVELVYYDDNIDSRPDIPDSSWCKLRTDKCFGRWDVRGCLEGQDLGTFALSNHHVIETEILKNELKRLKDKINGTPDRTGLRDSVERGDVDKLPRLEESLEQARKRELELRKMADLNRNVGYVYASSGFRYSPSQKYGFALDWSVTKVASPRSMQNLLDEQFSQSFIGTGESPKYWRKGIPAGLRVAKVGRTSGWTVGHVNSTEAVFSEKSRYGKKVYGWTIVPEGIRDSFAAAGDSGAIIFDADESSATRGSWVGLLFSANLAEGFGYFVPIETVLQDISTITGCEILEPIVAD